MATRKERLLRVLAALLEREAQTIDGPPSEPRHWRIDVWRGRDGEYEASIAIETERAKV